MAGSVARVSGPVVIAEGLDDAKMYDVVVTSGPSVWSGRSSASWGGPRRSRSTRTRPASDRVTRSRPPDRPSVWSSGPGF